MSVAAMRRDGYTAVQIGKAFGVSEKTIRRTNGWKEYKTYAAADKTDKTDAKNPKPEIDIDMDMDIEKEKEIDIEIPEQRKRQIEKEIGADGFITKTGSHLPNDNTMLHTLRELGYSSKEISYIINHILE